MRTTVGSAAPLMPMTGYFNSRGETRRWTEGNLENWNAYFTLRGAGEVRFERESVATRVGELLLLAPAFHRSYRIPNPSQGWEFYWLHFRPTPRLVHSLGWFDRRKPWQKHFVADVSLRLTLATLLEQAHHLNLTEPDLAEREPIMESMLETFLLRIAAAMAKPGADRAIDTRIERAIEHFHCDIAASTDVDQMARRAGLARSQFCRLFRQGTGSSPQRYVEERRLEMAGYYLRTTAQSVAEVAEMVGFQNAFYFTNRFRRRFRCSPSAYRLGARR